MLTKLRLCSLIAALFPLLALSQPAQRSPIQVVSSVADRVVRSTPWRYTLDLAKPDADFDFISVLDFKRTYGNTGDFAFAYSELSATRDSVYSFDISHSGFCKVYLNGQEAYRNAGTGTAKYAQMEREFTLASSFKTRLSKGTNTILIKASRSATDWKFLIQPTGGLVEFSPIKGLKLGFDSSRTVNSSIAKVSKWLILGPFTGGTSAIDEIYGPEKGLTIGTLYAPSPGAKPTITWELPRLEVYASLINSHPLWGTYYTYNYHAAGLAWALATLSQYTGNPAYNQHARRYTDFMIETKPFIQHQVVDLYGFRSAQHHMVNTPLLDFTAAPALPFVQRLLLEPNLTNKAAYRKWVDSTKQYVLNKQVRLPDGTFTRETPLKYTTWVDDMFMGIPFITYCALEAKDPAEKRKLFDEACKQVLGFNKNVFNQKDKLYHHAQYSTHKATISYWSRANGWGVFAASVLLENLPKDHPAYQKVLGIYQAHIKSIFAYQDKSSGMFHQIINDPSSYEEVSATGIFVMALAKGLNNNWVSGNSYRQAAQKGWQGLLAQIEPDGTVHNICVGTMSSEDPNYYKGRPVADNDSHGLIGLIWCGIEMDKLLKATK